MGRTICCAVFGVLFSSGAVFPQPHTAWRSLARPRVRVVGLRWFAPRPAIFSPYCVPVTFPYPVSDPVPYPVWNFITPSPTYVFVGSASPSHPQLVFKDGTTYAVTDYWRVNEQLHFITIEEGGTKSVPHEFRCSTITLASARLKCARASGACRTRRFRRRNVC